LPVSFSLFLSGKIGYRLGFTPWIILFFRFLGFRLFHPLCHVFPKGINEALPQTSPLGILMGIYLAKTRAFQRVAVWVGNQNITLNRVERDDEMLYRGKSPKSHTYRK
jgi:hypothetical protein